jgi:quinol monooxygenase YgiN
MSVLVVAKVRGDTATFQKALADRADEFAAFSTRAREMGAIHHRFGIGDGFVLVVDEWETAESFQQFFGDPKMQEFIGTIGAEPAPPEITITEAIASADDF